MPESETIERVDIDIDWDAKVPCWVTTRTTGEQCQEEATWVGTAHPCGHLATVCDKHYELTLKNIELGKKRGHLWCHAVGKNHRTDDITWRRL